MAIDMNRMAASAIEAALDDGQPRRRRMSGMRAVVAGAALATVARVAVTKGPDLGRMANLSRLGDLARVPDMVRGRLADQGWLDGDGEPDEPEGEELDEDEAFEEEDEPAGESDDELEGEADEGLEGEAAEDFEERRLLPRMGEAV